MSLIINALACQHCSGPFNAVVHGGPCPRVQAVEYHPNEAVRRVEFHGEADGRRSDERLRSNGSGLDVSRRASRIPLKGLYAFAIYRPGEGWPMSNYRPEGCKHDATGETEEKLNAGIPQRCVKCGCLLIPETTYRAALADFERRWGRGDEEGAP